MNIENDDNEKYEELTELLDENASAFDKLLFLNKELFVMVENSISLDLLAKLLCLKWLMKKQFIKK